MSDDGARARYPATTSAARQARRFVVARLELHGHTDLADDAGVITSELAANAVLHARTEFEVAVAVDGVRDGVRVGVHDTSPALPVRGTLGATATSGRGLQLVDALSARWGVDVVPGGGKVVWFELEGGPVPSPAEDADPDDLLEAWAALEEASARAAAPAPPDGRVEVRIADVTVTELLAAEAHAEGLARELALLGLAEGTGSPAALPAEDLAVVTRAAAAVTAFDGVRRSVRTQALAAAARGQETVELAMDLSPSDVDGAARYQQALADAARLSERGVLLLPHADGAAPVVVLRRWVDAVVAQLPVR